MNGGTLRGVLRLHQLAAPRLSSRCTVFQRQSLPASYHMYHHDNRPLVSASSRNSPVEQGLFSLGQSGMAPRVTYISIRGMAKRGIAKERKTKKGTGKPKVELSKDELNQVVNYDKMVQQMDVILDLLKQDFLDQLNLRTSAGVFDNLTVETPDGSFPLIQLGQVVQKNPQLLVINMGAMAHYIPAVKTAIVNSGMNLNPQQDGSSLFVPIPKVTREHRERLVKNAKTLCDKTKDKLRDTQNKFVRDVKKEKDSHSSDLIRNVLETIHLKTHDYVEKTEQLMVAKQQELMGK